LSGKYRLTYDWHTHTVFSHGTGSIEDNVRAAKDRGLRGVGISDHGPGHLFYGLRRARFSEMRAEIERLKPLYPETEILMGVEANILNASGRLDVRPEEFGAFDYILAGYHYGALGENPLHSVVTNCANLFYDSTGRAAKGSKAKNTALVEKALYTNDFKMVTHPGDKGPVDLRAVAEACAKTGTLFEINTGHDSLTEDDIKTAARTDVCFAISSDAHAPARVGDFMPAVELALRAGLDLSRIVNLERAEA
jgi:putative hydrolase